MEKLRDFFKKKDIVFSVRRYGIDALSAMAQGLFCSLLIGTILNTLGTQLHIPFLTMTIATVNGTAYTAGALASAMSGPALVGQIGVYTGWLGDVARGTKTAVTVNDWLGLLMISFVLPAVLCPAINLLLKKAGWVKDGDMKLS